MWDQSEAGLIGNHTLAVFARPMSCGQKISCPAGAHIHRGGHACNIIGPIFLHGHIRTMREVTDNLI